MEITEKLLSELQNRLKVGDRRSVHLNAIPGRSRYKFDLNRLSHIHKNLPREFLKALLTQLPLQFKISWQDKISDLNALSKDERVQIVRIIRSFENLINQTEAIESEKGINTFGFGFPLLIRKDHSDSKKIIVAPILIWSLRIKRAKALDTWVIRRDEDDRVYINEALINHLNSDATIKVDPISEEQLEDGLIDHRELLDICAEVLLRANGNIPENIREIFDKKLAAISSIADKKHYENLSLKSSNAVVDFCGLFSIFEAQKQNIIRDYDELMQNGGTSIDMSTFEEHVFQPISSVETDPSQQSILHSLASTRNILIQGPPGTGKSQSLTAVLVNALENRKKTIVVCEKRTALEVLHKALGDCGLSRLCVLIKDIVKDRKTVVNSVRERVDNWFEEESRYGSSNYSLHQLHSRIRDLIHTINNRHAKLGEKLLGDNDWTYVVGVLISELKSNQEDWELEFDETLFAYDSSDKLDDMLQLVQKGQRLYEKYKPIKGLSFINPAMLLDDNPIIIEQKLETDFKRYLQEFEGEYSIIRSILQYHRENINLFDRDKTERFFYKFCSVFSKRRKQTLIDQKRLYEACVHLANQIERDGWVTKTIDTTNSTSIITGVHEILNAKKYFFDNKSDNFLIEFRWIQFFNALSEVERTLIEALKPKEDWRRVFLIYYLHTLLVKSYTIDLDSRTGEYSELAESLSKVGREQLRYIRGYWGLKQKQATGEFNNRHRNLAVKNLYNKRGSHKHKRNSLRRIVQLDTDLFSTFFPIILTTPSVCSTLFQGMNAYFDIVLFDEASQLRLEDTLPALLKGKQIIIAGDEHQMPPSNYFSKIFDGAIDDEDDIEEEEETPINRDDILLSCESLLEFADELHFKRKYLDFHYRSKHPFLIDFSNHAFYNKRLLPLPNAFEYMPITYFPVNGTYADHSNEKEAEAVLSILEHNIQPFPNGEYPSVGIATFNITQRDLIKSKILERQKYERFAEFNQKIVELDEKGLFIKNLDNIQGEERDVIILSTTYGVNKNGKFNQRFGPVNQKKGYKLLNVIITRAKYKVYVCSSIPEEVFLNYKEHLIVEGHNNRRAVFFAYLAYAKAVSDRDSKIRQAVLVDLISNSKENRGSNNLHAELEAPFEEEVYEVLANEFDKQQIIPQLQFAGFRIDIVYDPMMDGIPKVAIECDGAAYHSSEEAYLYDHYRQKILEDHNFVFHRIWSTDWWRNPEREAKRLIEFIKSIENRLPEPLDEKAFIALSLRDDFIEPGDKLSHENSTHQEEFAAFFEPNKPKA